MLPASARLATIETIGYDDYTELNGEQGARDAGRLRQEGKDYVVQDGDVMLEYISEPEVDFRHCNTKAVNYEVIHVSGVYNI